MQKRTKSMHARIFTLALGLLAGCTCLTFQQASATATEEPLKVQVELEGAVQPQQYVGLLLSADKVLQKKITSSEKSATGSILLTFSYLPSEVAPDSVASAYAISEDGRVAMAHVRPLFPEASPEALLALPTCPPEKVATGSIKPEQRGVLETLIEFRAARRELARDSVRRMMDGTFLEDLRQLEAKLGLGRVTPLSPELGPVELVDRLSRLTKALQNYQNIKEPRTVRGR
jgi:hypothetical protein